VSQPKSPAPQRDAYVHFLPIQTRWEDNDVYGHVNNVVYYAYFDTAINHWLVHEGGLDIHEGESIGLVVESMCHYLAPASYPEELEAGLSVGKLGRSSVRYDVAIFRRGTGDLCAHGHVVHVFVDRASRRPLPMPERLRGALERLVR
jgi:acyl-CoA thioester hydrolase